MPEIFIDLFYYDEDDDSRSDTVADYDEINWKVIKKKIFETITDDGDFPVAMVERIEIYSDTEGRAIKIFQHQELVNLINERLHKCNSIW